MKTEFDQAKWTPEERQQLRDRGFRARREGEHLCCASVRPDDYEHDLKRGTVEWNPLHFNYALHSVTIPDGLWLHSYNFAQAVPNTQAVFGKNLTFVDCNLVNVAIDPSWNVDGALTVQNWIVKVKLHAETGQPLTKDDHPDTPFIERETRQYICSHPDNLKGDEKPPQNAVVSREF